MGQREQAIVDAILRKGGVELLEEVLRSGQETLDHIRSLGPLTLWDDGIDLYWAYGYDDLMIYVQEHMGGEYEKLTGCPSDSFRPSLLVAVEIEYDTWDEVGELPPNARVRPVETRWRVSATVTSWMEVATPGYFTSRPEEP